MNRRFGSELTPAERRTRLALITTLVGFGAATLAAVVTVHQVRTKSEELQQVLATSLADHLQSQIRLIEGYVYAMSGYYSVDRAVGPDEFAAFAEKLGPIHAVRSLQFVRAVRQRNLDVYRARQRSIYGASFDVRDKTAALSVKPAAARAIHYPIEMVYPLKGNEPSLGLDIASNPAAINALTRARKEKRIAATTSFSLVQDKSGQAFSLYWALLNDQTSELTGAVSALVSVQRLTDSVISGQAKILRISDIGQKADLFRLDASRSDLTPFERDIAVGDMTWRIRVGVMPESSPLAAGLLVFGLGAVLTLLALGSLDLASLQAQNRAADRKLSEREESLLVQETAYSALFYNAGTANAEIDSATGAILRSNETFDDLTGYAAVELEGKPLAALFTTGDAARITEALDSIGRNSARSFQLECRLIDKNSEPVWVLASISAASTQSGQKPRICVVMQDISKRKEVERGRDFLVRELAHRLRNTMQLVTSLAEQTARSVKTATEYRDSLRGRLSALTVAQDALFETNWAPVQLDILARRVLEPFNVKGDGPIAIDAAPITLSAQQSQTIALALHELGSNAARHGALGHPGGSVALTLSVINDENDDERNVLNLIWRENSQTVSFLPPSRRGFGSVMLEQLLAQQHGGETRFDWQPQVMTFTARLPLGDERG